MKLINDISTRYELADLLHIRLRPLAYVLYISKPNSYYRTFYIPKKNGDLREIQAPCGKLKYIQQRLMAELNNYQDYLSKTQGIKTNIAHAFIKKKSIISNASIHKNKRIVINVDLKDFFHTIHFGRVKGFFEKNHFYQLPSDIATMIAQITCYNGHLPQGAPSSPVITNLICQVLDYNILRIAKKHRLDYTRYADDLTFSTNKGDFMDNYQSFMTELSKEIERNGFIINENKTRLVRRESKQTVTGLTVNKKINVDRSFYKLTRAMADCLYKTGSFDIDGEPGTINMLEGRFSFIDQIVHYNNINDGKKHDYRSLCARERDYQKFLFYKYFYANERPLIITEGKTDVLHLKSALRKLYLQYPDLIQKKQDGSFEYKISFFRRTKRMKYFFNISPDGADTMKSIYQFYTGRNNVPNYFQTLSARNMENAVIFLFDNETCSERPLKKFMDWAKLQTAQRTELKSKLYAQLIDDSKLYLATTPLLAEKKETEIEDLYTESVQNIKLSGKEFCRASVFDSERYYGKDIFSKYVYNHYDSIDFSGFVPLLDAIRNAIQS